MICQVGKLPAKAVNEYLRPEFLCIAAAGARSTFRPPRLAYP